MRITCPKCKATYEVGEADIPDEGIEVECSACLNRWMQMPDIKEPEEAAVVAEPEAPAPVIAEHIPEVAPTPEYRGEPEVEPEPELEVVPVPEEKETGVSDFTASSHGAIPAWDAPNIAPIKTQPDAPEDMTSLNLRGILGDDAPEIESPVDLTEEAPQPTTGWRVPKPPESSESAPDPLDEILAEVTAEAQASAVSAPAASTDDSPETETVESAEPALDIASEPEPEPALHWSQAAASLAPVAAALPRATPAASAEEATDEATSEEATKGMEDLIRTLSDNAQPPADSEGAANAESPAAGASSVDEEEVFHPWAGEKAPDVFDQAEDDEFDWDEPEDADSPLIFDPEPDNSDPKIVQHMAALERQNQGDLKQEPPRVSNVIRADIPQAPFATMPSRPSKSARPAPSKPTPVDSAGDVEAAIRAQLVNMKKPAVKAVVESAPEKTGLFAKLAKSKTEEPAKPQPVAPKAAPSNSLKDALMDIGDAPVPRSGKRKGFMLVMMAFLIALAAYLFGESLAAAVPALEPYISGFISMVDGLRAVTQKLIGG